MTQLTYVQIPCLADNYAVIVHAPHSGETAVVDAPDAAAIEAALDQRGWRLSHLLVTHHHTDHTGGVAALKAKYGCRVFGPEGEADRIPVLDQAVSEKSALTFAGMGVRVIETPGHTLGHIAYVIPEAKVAFTGDTLFSLGCGRIFEGDAEGMWGALQKLMSLPADTQIYCGHEYTATNGRFALSVEPENEALQARMRNVEALRGQGKPTLPTTLAAELATNPFLRPNSSAIRARLGLQNAPDWQVFARLRELKNKA
jgi:hydroxyacylglutathione hydrolase